MALGDPYATTAAFKARLNVSGTTQDAVIAPAILAASPPGARSPSNRPRPRY